SLRSWSLAKRNGTERCGTVVRYRSGAAAHQASKGSTRPKERAGSKNPCFTVPTFSRGCKRRKYARAHMVGLLKVNLALVYNGWIVAMLRRVVGKAGLFYPRCNRCSAREPCS